MLRNSIDKYGSLAKLFHWLISFLVICMLILGALLEKIPDSMQKTAFFFHKSTGVLILFLMVLRAVWALTNPKPHLPQHFKTWMKCAAHGLHFVFYVILIAMPVTGIVMSSYAGRPASFFGLFQVALPVAKNKPLAEFYANFHNYLAWTILVLLIIHIFIALVHHFFYRDDVLRRMMPGNK